MPTIEESQVKQAGAVYSKTQEVYQLVVNVHEAIENWEDKDSEDRTEALEAISSWLLDLNIQVGELREEFEKLEEMS